MIQRNPVLDFFTHLILVIGVAVVFFPIYVTFIGSTQTAQQISSSNPISLLPGSNFLESYRFALFGGKTEAGATVSAITIAISTTDCAAEPLMSSALKPS